MILSQHAQNNNRVWISTIVGVENRDKLISYKGDKALAVYSTCGSSAKLNALLTGGYDCRDPWSPRCWNRSSNSPSPWAATEISYNSSILEFKTELSVNTQCKSVLINNKTRGP